MTDNQAEGLLNILYSTDNKDVRAAILQMYIQEKGPVPKEYGAKIRSALTGKPLYFEKKIARCPECGRNIVKPDDRNCPYCGEPMDPKVYYTTDEQYLIIQRSKIKIGRITKFIPGSKLSENLSHYVKERIAVEIARELIESGMIEFEEKSVPEKDTTEVRGFIRVLDPKFRFETRL